MKAAAVETVDYPGVAASERRAMRVTAKAVAAMEGGLVGATAVAVVKMVALVDAPAEVHLVGYTVNVALKGEEMATLVAVKEDRAYQVELRRGCSSGSHHIRGRQNHTPRASR